MKVNLLNFTLPKLEAFFEEYGEKKFRARQVFRWLHVYGAESFEEMTDIAKTLRAKLEEIATIEVPKLVSEQNSSDGTRKWALEVGTGNKIEAVFIPEDDRGTLCISSQVGCALECQFCSTARQGFNRNLSTGEIVGQLWWANKRLGKDPKGEKIITNVVMMGMGEPLANYDSVIDAMKIMLDDNAYNLSKRKLTLSTSGIVPKLIQLGDDCPVSLAVSLHASNDEVRDEIIPLNKKYPLDKLLDACRQYLAKSPKNYVTFEYVMLKDVNDLLEHAHELVELMRGIECKFNLIPFNPFPNSGFESSSRNQIVRFQKILQDGGYIATVRKTRGDDIDAACGQLVGKVKDKTKRQEKWKNYIPIQIKEE
ncbi:MAG: 23S rRNA (adenine(2503)-C(2))-methyltransferase RlmN [Burkholderiales bacterium]|nr:23S rRNA (adenine(2503)-C(2))-methyltransferase RlmN [Burkholderiales bacterium]